MDIYYLEKKLFNGVQKNCVENVARFPGKSKVQWVCDKRGVKRS